MNASLDSRLGARARPPHICRLFSSSVSTCRSRKIMKHKRENRVPLVILPNFLFLAYALSLMFFTLIFRLLHFFYSTLLSLNSTPLSSSPSQAFRSFAPTYFTVVSSSVASHIFTFIPFGLSPLFFMNLEVCDKYTPSFCQAVHQ